MSVWGKVIGGVAGFALVGPLGALIGVYAGHKMDKAREGEAAEPAGARPGGIIVDDHGSGLMRAPARRYAGTVILFRYSLQTGVSCRRTVHGAQDTVYQVCYRPQQVQQAGYCTATVSSSEMLLSCTSHNVPAGCVPWI